MSATVETKPELLRFWLVVSGSMPEYARIEVRYPEGIEQTVVAIGFSAEGQPTIGRECPDAIVESAADLIAWAAHDRGSDDRRFAGWDSSRDAAEAECELYWNLTHPEAA